MLEFLVSEPAFPLPWIAKHICPPLHNAHPPAKLSMANTIAVERMPLIAQTLSLSEVFVVLGLLEVPVEVAEAADPVAFAVAAVPVAVEPAAVVSAPNP